MKKIYLLLLLAFGMLIGPAATVKAEIKPDSATHSTSAKIIPVGGGLWNYTNAQLCAMMHYAIPDFNSDTVVHEVIGGSIHWLTFKGTYTSTGTRGNLYMHLEQNGDWFELDIDGIPMQGGGAWSCSGRCFPDDEEGREDTETVCKNVSVMVMVLCGCTGGNGGASTDCVFKQYPTSVIETMSNLLTQIHN